MFGAPAIVTVDNRIPNVIPFFLLMTIAQPAAILETPYIPPISAQKVKSPDRDIGMNSGGRTSIDNASISILP